MPQAPAALGEAAFLAVLEPYERAFVEPDPERRNSLLRASLTPTAEIWGPSRVFAGYEQVSAKIDAFAKNWAACRLVRVGPLVVFRNLAHFAMAIVNESGRALASGHSVVELAQDGRIQRVLAFWSHAQRTTPAGSSSAA